MLASCRENRDQLLDGDIAAKFVCAILAQPRVKDTSTSTDFVNELRLMNVTLHVAQNTSNRHSAATRHGGYVASKRIRKRIEEAFGWIKIRRSGEDPVPRCRPRRLGLHLRCRSLQSHRLAEAPRRGANMIVADHLLLIGTSADGASQSMGS
jgi:hypothetical protein